MSQPPSPPAPTAARTAAIPLPWVGVGGAVVVAFASGAALVREPGSAALLAILSVPLLAGTLARLGGPQASTVLGISLLGAGPGVATLAMLSVCAPPGRWAPTTPNVPVQDEQVLTSGAMLAAGVYLFMLLALVAARAHGARFERVTRGVGALVATATLAVTLLVAARDTARPTRDAWFAGLVDETKDYGFEHDGPYVVVVGERVTTDRWCRDEHRGGEPRPIHPLTSWRDRSTDVYVVICDHVGLMQSRRFVVAYRRGPKTPLALDPANDRAGMRFAAPRAWQVRAAAGAGVGCLWMLLAALWRSRALRALIETTRSHAGYREPAWSGAITEVAPEPDDPRVLEVEQRCTGAWLCAAALIVVTCVPVAVSW